MKLVKFEECTGCNGHLRNVSRSVNVTIVNYAQVILTAMLTCHLSSMHQQLPNVTFMFLQREPGHSPPLSTCIYAYTSRSLPPRLSHNPSLRPHIPPFSCAYATVRVYVQICAWHGKPRDVSSLLEPVNLRSILATHVTRRILVNKKAFSSTREGR